MSITNCTFAEAQSVGGTNGVGGTVAGCPGCCRWQQWFPRFSFLGANLFNNGGTFNLKNSIVAYPTNALNIAGTIIDLDNNICSDTSAGFTQTNSFNNIDPLLLLPLATNGGPTLTIELQAGSPAIDAIYDGSAPVLDQRDFIRSSFGVRPDIGAVEYGFFSISGKVTFTGGGGDSGASISAVILVGTTNIAPVAPAADGTYTLTGLPAGSYTVTPQQTGFTFSPSNAVVLVPPNTNNVNFTATVATFTLSGQITIAGTVNPVPNATVTATGTNAANVFSVQTDVNGAYTFTNLLADSYTITPQPGAGVIFSPVNFAVVVPPGTNVNFTATVTSSAISGKVTLNGNSYTNATVIATGTNSFNSSNSYSAAVNASGNYSFPNLPPGSYTVGPQAVTGVSFSPGSSGVTAPPGNTNLNFAGSLIASTISGHVTTNGTGVANETVTATGTSPFTNTTSYSTATDASGNYKFTNLLAASYTLTPQAIAGYSFTPGSTNVSAPPGSTTANFAAAQILSTITGQVNLGTNAFTNVVIVAQTTNVFNVTNSFTNTTGATGQFVFANLASGAYLVTPQPIVGVSFSPGNAAAVLAPGTNLTFTATPIGFSITGRVLLNGNAFPNAAIVAHGTNAFNSNSFYTNQTDASGPGTFSTTCWMGLTPSRRSPSRTLISARPFRPSP